MLHHLIRADSEKSYDDALNLALEQAAALINDLHDAHIVVTDLSCDNGQTYHCEIEVALAAIGLMPETDSAAGQFSPMNPEEDRDYRVILTKGRDTLRQAVEDFLKGRTYVNLDRLPDFILTRIRPDDLLDKIVIHDFQDAAETPPPELAEEFREVWQEIADAPPGPVICAEEEQPQPE